MGDFSLVWAGHIPGESLMSLLGSLGTAKDLHEVKTGLQSLNTWKSIPANVVMADNSGNIGYMLLSSSPIRKNEYPYLGCRILDGTTSTHDWQGLVNIE